MKTSKEYVLEDFLNSTNTTIKNLEEIDDFLDSEHDKLTEISSAGMRETFIAAESEGLDFQLDGYAEITVSDDAMEAAADFYPPSEGKQPLSLDDVAEILAAKGVTCGIDWDFIKEMIFKCNTESTPVTDIIIARGTIPVKEVPAHLVIEEQLLQKSEEIGGKNEKIDFREVSPFVLVKAGDILAKQKLMQAGVSGTTLFGKTTPYGIEKITTLKLGKNTSTGDDGIVADCDGRFELLDNMISVNEVLQINNDVDYSTGHINFPGDVILRGEIKDGFSIKAGGTIYCGQTMDASEIVSEKDLTVKLGIIGRKKGSVKSGGKIKAKFIENCYVEAKDTIFLEVGIMNSAVYTSNRIELEKKGVIVGGIMHAQNGVTATQIGTKMGPRTEIHCGIDYIIANKLDWIRDNALKLAFKLKQIDEQLKNKDSEQSQLQKLREKIQASIHKLNESAMSLIYKLDKNEHAEVVVRGKVYPGVYIEICHISYVVGREMNCVRFRLNKEKGIITVEKL